MNLLARRQIPILAPPAADPVVIPEWTIPTRPLRTMRQVSVEGPHIAVLYDEYIRSFPSQAIFQPAPTASSLSIDRSSPILLRLEMLTLELSTLVPTSQMRIVVDKLHLGWCTSRDSTLRELLARPPWHPPWCSLLPVKAVKIIVQEVFAVRLANGSVSHVWMMKLA